MNYLKNAFFFILFLCLCSTLQAQISIGPKLGINLASRDGSNVAGDGGNNLLGLQFGAIAEIEIHETFAIQPEILFFQKGSKAEYELMGETIKAKSYLNYLEVPVLAKLQIYSAGGTAFFVTAGPSFGYAINGKVISDGEEEDIDFNATEINRFEISASVGAGIQFSAGHGNLFIDARYLLGLSNYIKSGRDLDIKNRGFGFATGFLFPIGGE